MLSPCSNSKTRGCYCSCWASDDGHEDTWNMLSCTQTTSNKLEKLLHLIGWFIWMEVLQFVNVSCVRFIMRIEVHSFYYWNPEITFSTNTHYHRLSVLLLTFLLVLVAFCFIVLVFFKVCQLHNIAEWFLKYSCCVAALGLWSIWEWLLMWTFFESNILNTCCMEWPCRNSDL